ncbi:hypothetical protein [Bosea sp. BK604]|uniref:hypothetical protein n=1 Tax=Bosea sp. BK604 TaxID=2512180 RepID=UPI00104D8460|nr:hypothetical protein [Bosea sp. BK604]
MLCYSCPGEAMATQTDNIDPPSRFPGVLNSQELLVAEAVHARAWHALQSGVDIDLENTAEARDRLGRIVVQLMLGRNASTAELASAAISLFRDEQPKRSPA